MSFVIGIKNDSNDYERLMKSIKYYSAVLSNPKNIFTEIKNHFNEIKKEFTKTKKHFSVSLFYFCCFYDLFSGCCNLEAGLLKLSFSKGFSFSKILLYLQSE